MFCKVIGMNHFAEAPTLFADHDDVQRVTTRAPSYLADHRKRLRERFNSVGAAAIPDYELLELVLFRAIPRQDVKPLARALIDNATITSGRTCAFIVTSHAGCGTTPVASSIKRPDAWPAVSNAAKTTGTGMSKVCEMDGTGTLIARLACWGATTSDGEIAISVWGCKRDATASPYCITKPIPSATENVDTAVSNFFCGTYFAFFTMRFGSNLSIKGGPIRTTPR
jgi:hypothetical protein